MIRWPDGTSLMTGKLESVKWRMMRYVFWFQFILVFILVIINAKNVTLVFSFFVLQ